MKELFILLIVFQAKHKLVTLQTPQVVKQIICTCGSLPEAPLAVQISPSIVHQGARDARLSGIEGQEVQIHLQ